ncbi:hypothetical protein R9C00_13345 [Flammeovirgaceae bacterium SG7u.111]|nr:hypothetical protein [Flammeovirgaceae bacterium SG7u.132]WPO38442.1 hypothetical protein R9C00_13345 [Flammeovirgaceae bacterium SG7u.111]
MKSILFIVFQLFAVSIVGSAFAQCNADLYSEKSMKNISSGFLYEKSYRVDGKSGRKRTIEYSCILSKDTNYSFTMSTKDGGANGLVFSLLDGERNTVATNYYNNKFFEGLQYKCKSTGLYFMNFSFKESKSHCGAAVLAFRR